MTFSDDSRVSPWILETLKPIRVARVDFDAYVEARKTLSTEEWIDLLMQSIGLTNPASSAISACDFLYFNSSTRLSTNVARRVS